MEKCFYLIAFFILIHNFTPTLASDGDRSPYYQNCVKYCLRANCTSSDGLSFTPEASELQDPWSRLLRWSCRDECRYHCMWRTTAAFKERDIETPKFHGKWPFQRIYGIQEPASAISSVLNLASNAYMYVKILNDRRFSLKDTKLLLFWHLFAVVCMNAWVWSTIFHTRDTPFTEFMDYAGALSMVMGLFVAAIVRVFHSYRRLCGLLLLTALLYYAEHVQYLYMGRIDYDYNMAVNVVCGVMGSFLWMAWSVYHWYSTGSRYVWRMVAFNKLNGAALLLEVVDFPPLLRAWDAHALWHLSTAPLPLLFYKFVIDDLEYLQQATKIPEKTDFKLA